LPLLWFRSVMHPLRVAPADWHAIVASSPGTPSAFVDCRTLSLGAGKRR
jgi:hypothetical protein